MYIKPKSVNASKYWLFHPHQPKIHVPFRPLKAYYSDDGSHRKWLSYSIENEALFCNICIFYGDGSGSFSKGYSDW